MTYIALLKDVAYLFNHGRRFLLADLEKLAMKTFEQTSRLGQASLRKQDEEKRESLVYIRSRVTDARSKDP